MNQSEKLFCREPFRRLEIHNGGDCFLCCPTWLPTSIGNINESDIPTVWNSQVAQSIRASILDGSFSYCDLTKCGEYQKSTHSLSHVNEVKEFDFQEIIADQSLFLDRGPSTIALSQDRTCNLSCPSCRMEIFALTKKEKELIENIHPKVINQLRLAEWVKITGGGDPFASPYYSKLLESISTEDFPNLKIFLHTNALLFTPDRWERIKKIRRSIHKVEVSVDAATTETYEKNRRGGKFSTLEKNLAFIGNLRKENHFSNFYLSFVVQKNNWREMADFVGWAKQFNADSVLFSKIISWKTFSDSELKERSVHEEEHDEHDLFKSELKKPIFRDSFVNLSNLHYLSEL